MERYENKLFIKLMHIENYSFYFQETAVVTSPNDQNAIFVFFILLLHSKAYLKILFTTNIFIVIVSNVVAPNL